MLDLFVWDAASGGKVPAVVNAAAEQDPAATKDWQTSRETKFVRSLPNRVALRRTDDGELPEIPIYCTADETAYQYFMEQGANIFGDIKNFDAIHGISAYNKTDQMKLEDENSAFMNPRFVKATEQKPVVVWIISVGRHEGFIPFPNNQAAAIAIQTARQYRDDMEVIFNVFKDVGYEIYRDLLG